MKVKFLVSTGVYEKGAEVEMEAGRAVQYVSGGFVTPVVPEAEPKAAPKAEPKAEKKEEPKPKKAAKEAPKADPKPKAKKEKE